MLGLGFVTAAMGIDGATVDLVLDKTNFIPGEEITGKFILKGGSADQNFKFFESFLNVQVTKHKESRTIPITGVTVEESLFIKAKETREIPVEFSLPKDMPVSSSKVRYYISTKIDIKYGKDTSDHDNIVVELPHESNLILDVIKKIGFQYKDDYIGIRGQFFEFTKYNTGECLAVSLTNLSGGTFVKMSLSNAVYNVKYLYTEFYVPKFLGEEEKINLISNHIDEVKNEPFKFASNVGIYREFANNESDWGFLNGFVIGTIF